MTLAKPQQNLALPLAIQRRVDTMFAGETGLSGPEMLQYFSRLDPNVEQYSWSGGMPSRKQILQDCLARFSREQQMDILKDMLSAEIYGRYQRPKAEDIEFVLAWVATQSNTEQPSNAPMSVNLVFREPLRPSEPPSWDVFISHASEDKEEIAKPLATALTNRKLRVWYDDFTLTVGDSLRRSIDRGLSQSKFGIVILSEAFFQKHWPQLELDGLVARESMGKKVILPVWHRLDASQIRQHSPLLADRVAVSSTNGLSHVVEQLMQVIRPASASTAA